MKRFIISYPNRKSFKKNKILRQYYYSGFLLIELLVALLIVVLFFTSILRLLQHDIMLRSATYHRFQAANGVSSVIEEIKAGLVGCPGKRQVDDILITWACQNHTADRRLSLPGTEHLFWIEISAQWYAPDNHKHTTTFYAVCQEPSKGRL